MSNLIDFINEHLIGKTISTVEGIGECSDGTQRPPARSPLAFADELQVNFTDGSSVKLSASYDDSAVHLEAVKP